LILDAVDTTATHSGGSVRPQTDYTVTARQGNEILTRTVSSSVFVMSIRSKSLCLLYSIGVFLLIVSEEQLANLIMSRNG
jgi:hypothetical protein